MVAFNDDSPKPKKKKPGRKAGANLQIIFARRYVPLTADREPAYHEALRALHVTALPCGCIPMWCVYCAEGFRLRRAMNKAYRKNITGRLSFAEYSEKRKAFERHLRGGANSFHEIIMAEVKGGG